MASLYRQALESGQSGQQAIEKLITYKNMEARKAVEALIQNPQRSRTVLRLIGQNRSDFFLEEVSLGFDSGNINDAMMAIDALIAIRNVKSIRMLEDRAATDKNPAVRRAAWDARKKLFTVEGEK